MWTSNNANASFNLPRDYNVESKHAVLNVQYFPGSHTAE